MILEEFVYQKDKSERLGKALEGLNKKRAGIKGKEDFCDDSIKPDCKCDWEGDCEDNCRHQHR